MRFTPRLAAMLLVCVACAPDNQVGTISAPALIVPHLNAGSLGEWTPIIPWPETPVHAQLLSDGKVLSWASDPNTATYQAASVWDPALDSYTLVANTVINMFCSGHTTLPDGRLLVTGGHDPGTGTIRYGLRAIQTFDPVTETWAPAGTMASGRWYPTNTTLGNGSVLIVSGLNSTGTDNKYAEIWTNGTVRKLTPALSMPLYPWMYLMADGRVFNPGPNKQSRFLNTVGKGAWVKGPVSRITNRGAGASVMYDLGKIMMVGGANPPTATADIIDMNGTRVWKPTANMSRPRRQHTATVLPTGDVLVTGGTYKPGPNDPTGAVYTPELWNPTTGLWTALNPMAMRRTYHSIALLLPDGRILVGGGTDVSSGELSASHPDAEIFSPPYLFNPDDTPAIRPTITTTPGRVTHGEVFRVETADAATIAAVSWIRIGSVTHTFNQDNRFQRLAFSADSAGLTVNAPSAANLSPPGYYMLFILNSANVPSIAAIIRQD